MRKAKDRVPKFEREKQRECVRKAKDRIPKLVRGERERFSLEVSFQAAAAVALQPTLSVLVEEERARGRVGGGAAAAGLTRWTCVTTA